MFKKATAALRAYVEDEISHQPRSGEAFLRVIDAGILASKLERLVLSEDQLDKVGQLIEFQDSRWTTDTMELLLGCKDLRAIIEFVKALPVDSD